MAFRLLTWRSSGTEIGGVKHVGYARSHRAAYAIEILLPASARRQPLGC